MGFEYMCFYRCGLQFFAGKRHGGLGEITLSKMHIFT